MQTPTVLGMKFSRNSIHGQDWLETGLFQFCLSQSPIVSLLNQNKGKSLESAPLTTCVASREQIMTRMR